jgi:hypothetical protein
MACLPRRSNALLDLARRQRAAPLPVLERHPASTSWSTTRA